MRIDLNADLGEGFGAYAYGADEALLPLVTSANIACGWHGGDPSVIRRAVKLAVRHGTVIGAHPGYPDPMGFGRRDMNLSEQEVVDGLLYQLGALDGICRAEGTCIRYVKPHGAMYNAAGKNKGLAQAIAKGIWLYSRDLTVLCPAGGLLQQAAQELGLATAGEFFADRAYEDDGALVARSKPGALLHDPEAVCRRVLRAAKTGTVQTVTGNTLGVQADSVCLHGDTPEAVELATAIRKALEEGGVALKSFVEM